MTVDNPDSHLLLAVAEQAARAGGHVARSKAHGTITDKGDRDLVSEADLGSERAIREVLSEHVPDVPVLGEEGGGPKATGPGLLWVVDPIDGTVNHLHGLPIYAVAISLLADGEPIVAATYLPETDTMYTAIKGHGAHRNGDSIASSSTSDLRSALVAMDQFAFTGDDQAAMNLARFSLLGALFPVVGRIRIHGASAVDLVWVADGSLDACVMLGNKPWDTSGGVLIAREAGATATDLKGASHRVTSHTTVAAGSGISQALIAAFASVVS